MPISFLDWNSVEFPYHWPPFNIFNFNQEIEYLSSRFPRDIGTTNPPASPRLASPDFCCRTLSAALCEITRAFLIRQGTALHSTLSLSLHLPTYFFSLRFSIEFFCKRFSSLLSRTPFVYSPEVRCIQSLSKLKQCDYSDERKWRRLRTTRKLPIKQRALLRQLEPPTRTIISRLLYIGR